MKTQEKNSSLLFNVEQKLEKSKRILGIKNLTHQRGISSVPGQLVHTGLQAGKRCN
jgi:hypothetical protein